MESSLKLTGQSENKLQARRTLANGIQIESGPIVLDKHFELAPLLGQADAHGLSSSIRYAVFHRIGQQLVQYQRQWHRNVIREDAVCLLGDDIDVRRQRLLKSLTDGVQEFRVS